MEEAEPSQLYEMEEYYEKIQKYKRNFIMFVPCANRM